MLSDLVVGPLLLLTAIGVSALNLCVFVLQVRRSHGFRRMLSAFIWCASLYTFVVYGLSLLGWLPDGAAYLSFLLRPAVVALLSFLAAYGILDRRR